MDDGVIEQELHDGREALPHSGSGERMRTRFPRNGDYEHNSCR